MSSPPATEQLLPQGIKPGRPPVWTRRQLMDGMRWRTRTSVPWHDVPERYEPWDRAHAQFRPVARRHLGGDRGRSDCPGSVVGDPEGDRTGCGQSKGERGRRCCGGRVIASLVASGAEHRSNGPARARVAAPGGFVVLSYARPGCPSLETSCDPDPRCLASLWR
ncbi:transposase [Streptomyces barringtoniae]|uniref:transposase n=2 Tax=Streptomyces TaxID=1883 RepID=UPI001E403290|nr:transposase [Streptomyces barringtoniae]MCC5480891.1 transposase [Streptomyces barringtoniae]